MLVLIKCVGPSVPEVTLAPPLIDESNRQLLLEVQYNNHPDGGSTRDIRYYCFATIVPSALADEIVVPVTTTVRYIVDQDTIYDPR